MSSPVVYSHYCIVVDQEVQANPAENVEAVETCNEEKEASERRRSVFVMAKRGAYAGSMNKVRPFPGLAAKEGQASDDCPEHPLLHLLAVHAMTGFNGQHHGDAAHDEDKGHYPNKLKWQRYPVKEGDGLEYPFRYRPVCL